MTEIINKAMEKEEETWKHSLIATKADLKDWLSFERKRYLNITHFWRLFAVSEEDLIWRYQNRLRKTEYYVNTKKTLRYLCSRFLLNRLMIKTGLNVRINSCGRGLKIVHLSSVFTNGDIGENFTVHADAKVVRGADLQYPVLGNNVILGTGAVVSGGAFLADGIAVGANAYVGKKFSEPNITIAGVPARKVSNTGSSEWLL